MNHKDVKELSSILLISFTCHSIATQNIDFIVVCLPLLFANPFLSLSLSETLSRLTRVTPSLYLYKYICRLQDFDPFIPIRVDKFSEKEIESYLTILLIEVS